MDHNNPSHRPVPSHQRMDRGAGSSKKGFFELLPSKTAFVLGIITAIFAIGTIGFVILGSCVLSGDCGSFAVSASDDTEKVVVADDEEEEENAAEVKTTTTTGTSVPAISDEDHVRGNADAELTLIEYSDFECPFCSRFHPTALQVMEEYEGKVKWVYRHFPLSFHPEAQPAAEASECAAEQDMFWEFADGLFENQSDLGDDFYSELAGDLGMNVSEFEDCFESGKYEDKVKAQAQAGAAAGVTGTPGSFIIDADGNATPIKGALPFSSVQSIIEEML